MDNNEVHRQAILNQGKMKDKDITHWLKMDNIEGNIDIGLTNLFEQTVMHDNQWLEMDNIEGNIDIGLTSLFEQTVMPDNQIPDVEIVQSPDVQINEEVHDVNEVNKSY